MRGRVVAVTFILLVFINGIEGKSVTKRHVRRDWLIIPDTIAFNIFQAVNYVSPDSAKYLWEIFGSEPVQKTRGFLIEKTSKLTVQLEEAYQKIFEFLEKKSSS